MILNRFYRIFVIGISSAETNFAFEHKVVTVNFTPFKYSSASWSCFKFVINANIGLVSCGLPMCRTFAVCQSMFVIEKLVSYLQIVKKTNVCGTRPIVCYLNASPFRSTSLEWLPSSSCIKVSCYHEENLKSFLFVYRWFVEVCRRILLSLFHLLMHKLKLLPFWKLHL